MSGTPSTPTAPAWFEQIVISIGCLLASIGVIGLALAIAGRFSTAAALALGVPVAVAGMFVTGRSLSWGSTTRAATTGALVAMAISLGFALWCSSGPSQHLLVNRDPGSYTATARWLVRDGSLEVRADQGGLGGDPDLDASSYAVYDSGDGNLQFQFNHLTSVALAVAYQVGGTLLMFRLPALAGAAGLLAIYAMAVRVTARPYASLMAPAILGLSMPMVFVARDAYSEPFTMLLVWSALLAAQVAVTHRRWTMGLVAGALLGATVATRVDSLVFLVATFPLLALWIGGAPDRLDRRGRIVPSAAMMGSLLAVAAVGVVDLQMRTGSYAASRGDQLAPLRIATVASLLVSGVGLVVWLRSERLRARMTALTVRTAGGVAAVVGGLLLAGWLIRPQVSVSRAASPISLVAALQEMAGVAVDGTRRYDELGLAWMSWYLGALGLGVAILGTAVLVYRFLRGTAPVAAVCTLTLLLSAGFLYWWRPSITPDQVWAMRRYVPAVLPGLAVMTAVVVAALADVRIGTPALRRLCAAALALLLLADVARITWPVRALREQFGSLDVVLEACTLVDDDASVVVVGAPTSEVLPQTLRSWCGVPTVAATAEFDADSLERVRRSVEAAGRDLVLVAGSQDALTPLVGQSPAINVTRTAHETQLAEQTLLRAPRAYELLPPPMVLYVVRIGT